MYVHTLIIQDKEGRQVLGISTQELPSLMAIHAVGTIESSHWGLPLPHDMTLIIRQYKVNQSWLDRIVSKMRWRKFPGKA